MNNTQPPAASPDWAMKGPDDPRHGSPNGYVNLGCRCDSCKAAWSAYGAARRAARSAN